MGPAVNDTDAAIDRLLSEALHHHREGRFAEADRLYARILSIDPDHVQSLHWRGILAAQGGRSQIAIELIGKAIALREDAPELHNSIANAFDAAGRPDDAMRHYKRATALAPDYAEAHFNLANAFRERNELAAATAHYRRTLELSPNDLNARINLGGALAEQGEFHEAVAQLEQVLAQNPGLVNAHLNIAHALAELGRLDDAVTHYRQALAASPASGQAFIGLGHALQQQGHLDQAVVHYRKALALVPDNARVHVDLGLALADQGKLAEAAAEADATLRLDRRSPSFPCYLLGTLLARCGRGEAAGEQFRRSLEQDPRDRRGARLGLAALGLGPIPDRAPEALLAALYELRAAWWDSAERTTHPYRGARLIAEALGRLAPNPAGLDVLDAGCGAGLVGTLIGRSVRCIDGVDLSPALLERARAHGIYRELHRCDLVRFLLSRRERYDVVTAGAVLVHFGDLRPVFAAAASCVRAGGLFIFTLFHDETDEDGMAVGSFALGMVQTGSYVHGRSYVTRAAQAEGFEVALLDREIHDYHDGQPRMGLIVGLRRGFRAA